jgi:hypothetical protein
MSDYEDKLREMLEEVIVRYAGHDMTKIKNREKIVGSLVKALRTFGKNNQPDGSVKRGVSTLDSMGDVRHL